MRAVAIIGSLGSGKTTAINSLLASGADLGTTLVVVNDVGKVNVDAARIKTVGEIQPLTAGCIGCSDLPAFLAILNDAKTKQVDTVIVEPTGIADGKEIEEAFRKAGISGKILCLFDVRHAERNRALGVVESQIKAADIIGLTWHAHLAGLSSILDPHLEMTLRQIGNTEGKEVVLINKNTLPQSVVEKLLSKSEFTPSAQLTSCSCGSESCRHDDHHHDHGVYTTTLRLRPDLTLAELAEAIAPHLHNLVRAKGVIASRQFDLVQGSFELGEMSTEDSFGNFIATKKWDELALSNIAIEKSEEIKTKKELMRGHEAPLKDTLSAIDWLLGLYEEAGVLSVSDRLRVDWEADAAFQLSLREGVPLGIQTRAIQNFVTWRLKSLELLRTRNWEVSVDELAYWKRRLGINLSYFSIQYPDFVGADLLKRISLTNPVKVLVEGLLALNTLSFNDEFAEERPELVGPSLSWGLKKGEITEDEATRVLFHCQALANANQEWSARWNRITIE